MGYRVVVAAVLLSLLAVTSLSLVTSEAGVFPFADDGAQKRWDHSEEVSPDFDRDTGDVGQPRQRLECKSMYEGDAEEVLQEPPTEGPTEQRYVNEFRRRERPYWIPENNVSLNDPDAGTYEVTRYPWDRPTREHLNESWRLYRRTFEAAERNGWFEYERALADGYVNVDGRHHMNVNYSFDGRDLDPDRPEQLVYYPDPDSEEMILAGVMYTTPTEGEQVGGPLTVWHYHPSEALVTSEIRRLIQRTPSLTVEEVRRAIGHGNERRTVEMIHVWFIDHPEGPFASSMSVPGRCLDEPDMREEQEFRRYLLSRYRRYFVPIRKSSSDG